MSEREIDDVEAFRRARTASGDDQAEPSEENAVSIASGEDDFLEVQVGEVWIAVGRTLETGAFASW